MGRFIAKRLIQALVVIVLISLFSYFLMEILPGDPVYAILGSDITKEQYDTQYKLMELDKPAPVRYWNWIAKFVQGDFGTSYQFKTPVREVLERRLPVTMYLGLISLVLSTVIGIFLGTLCGTNRGKLLDNVLTVLANLGAVVPGFWLAVVGMAIFAQRLNWLPSFGFSFPWETNLATSLRQSALPLLCYTVGGVAGMTRQMRSGMLEVIRQDYIRTARSKGLKERHVVTRHALKNAVIPVVTIVGMSLRNIVSGAVSIETVFAITGTGSLLVASVLSKDLPVIQACVMLIAIVVVLSNLVVDICYGYLDPRIRIQ